MRLLRTVRHLRFRQAVGQVRVRLERRLENPSAFARRPAPGWPGQPPVFARSAPQLLGPCGQDHSQAPQRGQLTFLNDTRQVGWPPRWAQPQAPKLWQYNLHYMEFLWSLPYEDAREAAIDWIANHRLARGQVGWEPYVVSLRVQNFCALFFWHFRAELERDAEFRQMLWESLWLQCEWLVEHCETHLLGNHLLENGIALALAGSSFVGEAAQRWRTAGLAILRAELAEQILPDGGHFERSPMYHLRTTYALALLMRCSDGEVARPVRPVLARLVRALRVMLHPDGEIALLNDSAFGTYPQPRAVLEFAAQLCREGVDEPAPGPALALVDTGFYGFRQESQGHYILCDAGPLGPDYLPGHAHADIFSFELSLAGRRVVVDSGVFDYQESASRTYCRSTAAHNTVVVAGQDQAELWAAFRVGRRGRPHDVTFSADGAGFQLEAWHDGYRHLRGHPRHGRRFVWDAGGGLLVRDRVCSASDLACETWLHLHPDCELLSVAQGCATLQSGGDQVQIRFAGCGHLRVQTTRYFPEFGRAQQRHSLVYHWRSAAGPSGFCVARQVDDFDLARGAVLAGRSVAF